MSVACVALLAACLLAALPATAYAAGAKTPASAAATQGLKDISVEVTRNVTIVRTGDGQTITLKSDPATLQSMLIGMLEPSEVAWFDAIKYAMVTLVFLQIIGVLTWTYRNFTRAAEEARLRKFNRR